MKSFKRIVGLLLCLAMVMSFVPTSIISVAKAATTTTDILEKINLSGTAAGGCSTNGADVSSIDDLIWYHETTGHESWNKYAAAVDGSASSVSSFNCGSNERADWYLDLSNTTEGYTAVDQFILYAGDSTSVPTTKVVFQLEDGTEWEQTFTTNWSSADDTLTHTFDETINATGMYVWQTSNTTACLGEIELYQYMTITYLDTANLNGVDISEYQIVYSASDLDYAKTAAEYIQDQILKKTGRQLDVVTDSTTETTYEILVGETSRSYSESISAPSETAMKFTFASNGTKIAMKADYFIIAGAAYYFVETYIGNTNFEVTANTGVTTQNTITKKANNYIFLIGDGMGEMHTRLFEVYGAAPTSGTYGFGDGEDIFYGYYLPYLGWQKTANISGAITDSAAAGTALATGYKTINGYVGKDQYLNDVKNMSELAMELGKSVAVISTEGCDGATPAAYSAHADGRYNDDEIYADHENFGGLLVDGYERYNAYTASEFEDWEPLYLNALNSVASDPDGFFIMYEEAEIDKVSHRLNYTSSAGYTGDTDREVLFRTVYRFNQAIANFMEYALYNPDTMVLITADHETAGLDENFEPTEGNPVDEQVYGSVWNHSLADVPVFAYGEGAEVFDGERNEAYENASIARTWAHLMTDGNADNFGNPAYPIIGSGESGDVDDGQNYYTELPDDATKVTVETPAFGYYDGDTNGEITEYYDNNNPPANLIDGIYNDKNNRTISGYYTYEEIENGEKVPVILFEFDEPVNVAGIKLTGYEYGRYNIEDFDIEVYHNDGYSTSWYTAATVRDAFTAGSYGEQITTPMEIGFPVVREATKMRIVVKGITDMTAESDDDADSAELATGSYIRVKEIEVYETEDATVIPEPTEPTEAPTTAPTQAPTSPAGSGQITVQSAIVGVYNDGSAHSNLIGQQNGAAIIDGDTDSSVILGSGSDGGTGGDGWVWGNDSAFDTYTPAAILTLSEVTAVNKVEVYASHTTGKYTPNEFTVEAMVNGNWQEVGSFTNSDWNEWPAVVEFDSVQATKIRVLVKDIDVVVENGNNVWGHWELPEIMLYGTSGASDTQLEAPDGLTITATKNTITATADAVTGGTLMFKLDNGEWQESGVFTGLEEGTTYTLYAKYVAEDGYIDSAETSVTVTTAKDIVIDGQIVTVPVENPGTPIVGYYSDNDTDGAITEYWIQKDGKGEEPSVLVDGITGSSADYNWTGYYTHEEIASGAKIPVYLFEYNEPIAFTGITIDGYKAMYYGIEDFTVQVYIEGEGWVTATTVADSFSSQLQEEYAPAETYTFAEPLYGTKIRILVNKLWDMYDWRYDDDNSYELATGAYIRLREITLLEDPDYVPPTNTQNVLKAPAYLNTTYISDEAITVVAPPSTEYPEAVIQYTAYLNGVMVATNTTGEFTGLEHNTAYTFYAQYIGDGETWLNSHLAVNTTATDKDQLPPPTNVQATLGTTTITATADPVDGGTLVYRLMDENHIAIQEWQESGTFTGLTAGTQYTIQVKYNGDAQHYDSEITELTVVTGHSLLEKPTLTVSGTTHNTITLNALAAVDGGSAEYSYSVDGVNWTTTTNPVITGLNANTTYYLRARYVATDDTHDSSLYSEIVMATTLTNELPTPVLTVTGTTDSSITVSANSNANGTLQFRINGGAWQASGEFTGLDRNTEYTIEAMYVGINGYMDSDVASTAATTLKTQLHNPTGLKQTNVTTNSITVTADTITGGTLMFRLAGGEWQTSGTFTGLTHGTTYTVEAMYVADEDYIDSATNTIQVKTLTILDAPDLTATSTETTITASAPAVTGGTLQYRINGGAWQTSPTFTGLDWNTTYTISAMYVASEGYVDSGITTISIATTRPADPTAGDYADLEAIPESGITPHVGYNRYSNHEAMVSENTTQAELINDGMYDTVAKIQGVDAVPADQLADGYRLLTIIYDLNAGATKIGAVELTGGNFNLTKFAIQVKNTEGKWQTVKFVTNDLFDISDALRNDTVLLTFTPVTGTRVRLLIDGYEANANNAPEIREMVVYEAKDDAQLEEKTPTSGTAAVMDNNKANAFTGTTATLTFAEPTSVKRLKLFGSTVENSIGAYTVKVQTSQGGEWTQVATGTAFSGASGENTCIVNLDQEYKVYGVQVIADKSVTIPEIEVYGYKGTFVPVAPDLPDVTPTDAPTRPAAVSPVQTTPVATEEFVVPDEPDWTETTPGNEGAWSETTPGNESAWSDPTPVVPDETGTEPTAPTQAATEAPVVMGWLDDVPASSVTPQVGYYKNGDFNTLTEVDADESLYLSDSCFAGGADVKGETTALDASKAKDKTLVPAAVLTFDKTRTIGGIELVLKSNRYPRAFDIDVLTTSGWVNVKSITDNTVGGTQIFQFDKAYEATAVRVRVYEYDDTKPQIVEFIALEVQTDEPLVKVPITDIASDASGEGGYPVTNLIDGDLVTYFQTFTHPGTYTMTLADGSYTSISRLKLRVFGNRDHTQVPADVTISVHTSSGWVEVYDGEAYQEDVMDYWFVDFDTYAADQIQVIVNSATSNNLSIITEFEVYGPGDGYFATTGSGTGAVGTTTVGSADYTEIELEVGMLKGCSEPENGVNTAAGGDYANASYCFDGSSRLASVIDGNPENTCSYWGISTNERGDIYINLGSSTDVSRIVFYRSTVFSNSYEIASKFQVSLLVGGNWVTLDEFDTGLDTSASVGDTYTYDFDQTYNATAIYIWATDCDSSTEINWPDFKLYKKNTVQLSAPANLQATEVGTNSITVAANTLNPAAAGTLKYQLKLDGSVVTAWTTDATFTNLTAGTTYTVEAMYVAADGYIDSGVSTITVTTATPIITEFTVSGTVTAGATVELYKGGVVKQTATATDGTYTFSNVSIGNYTLVVTKAGHTAQMMQITVDKDLTVETITLVSAYNVSGTTTAGATVTLYQSGAVKQTATADGSGNYSFGSVALGNYTLVFTKTGYYTQTASITVSDANVTKSVTLTQTGISGTVDAGATVELYQNGAVVATDVADDGSYSFSGVALGKYTLVFSLTGYHTQTAIITLSTEDVTMNVTLVSALYTVSGTTTAGATVTLYQNGEVYKTTTADGSGNYSFSDVLIGNYALTFTKAGYIAQGTTITVSGNLNVAAVALQPVPVNSTNVVVDAVANTSYNVRLYEPWALRVNVTFYTEKNGTPINLSNFKSYGAYAIIAHKFGDGTTAPTSWEEIISDPDAVQFKMAANEGDGNMFPTSGTTATFDHYDGLYTYRLAESVYWVAYYEDTEGTIHFTSVNKPVLMDKVDNIIEKISGDEEQDTQRIVLEHMKQLYSALINFRGEDAELGNNPYDAGTYLGNVDMGAVNNGTYQFGKTHKIRLIEPWSVKVTYQVRNKSTKTMLDLASATDYGVIIYHDKTGEYYGNMTAAQMLERKDAVVYSKEQGNITLEDGKMVAVYDKDIFTYEMDSEIYILPFVEVDGQYHYGTNASRIYLIDEMYAYYNNTTLSGKERATFRAMIELFESTIVHRKKFGK